MHTIQTQSNATHILTMQCTNVSTNGLQRYILARVIHDF